MGDKVKIDSRILSALSALLVVAIAISSVGAADLTSNGIESANFAIDIPSGSDFAEETTTNLNIGDFSISMEIFANNGENANDVSTVVYLKDSSKDQSVISDVINDLKKDGPIVEENEKYFIVETKDANNWDFLNFDFGNDIDSLWNFVYRFLKMKESTLLGMTTHLFHYPQKGLKLQIQTAMMFPFQLMA